MVMIKRTLYLLCLVVFSASYAQSPVGKGTSACLGLNGEVYLAWMDGETLYFVRSADGGKSWPGDAKPVSPVKNAIQYEVDGISMTGKPAISCDTSKGSYRGRIYISWSDEKYGARNKDVFLVYSDDKGANWTEPVLVTYRPNHKEQFKPVMSIDQKTGRLSLVYFDKQNYLNTGLCDVYMALSVNGGLKFDYYKLNELPVKLDATNPLVNEAFNDARGRNLVNWTNLDSKKNLVTFQTIITDSLLNRFNYLHNATEVRIEKSFSYASKIKIGIGFNNAMVVNAILTKPLEPGFEKVVIRNQKCAKGVTTVYIDTKQLGLAKGNYILTLYYNNKNSFVWITE